MIRITIESQARGMSILLMMCVAERTIGEEHGQDAHATTETPARESIRIRKTPDRLTI